MQNHPIRTVIAAAFLLLAAAPVMAQSESLYDGLYRKAEVKIYVAPPVDSTPEKKPDEAGLKTELEKAFTGRASIKFKVVPAKEEADLILETDITEYFWTDHDPVDMVVGLGGLAYDTATVENYVRVQVNTKILEGKTGREIWSKSVIATITDKTMTPETAVGLINSDFAKVLLKEAFSKRRSSRH